MTPTSPQAADVRKQIDHLIHAASNSQFDFLDQIYHHDMQIYLMDPQGKLNRSDKAGFTQHVKQSTQSSSAPSMWAQYHLVEADEDNGHVLISRKVNLTGQEQIVTLSIDLVHEDDRWQITREVIFAGQPN